MWVDFDEQECAAIVERFGSGAIVDKILARPHLQTGAFVNAAEDISDDRKFVVDESAIIERQMGGAWVMGWIWVDEYAADVPPALEHYGVSKATQKRIKALSTFRIGPTLHLGNELHAIGRFENYKLHFEARKQSWLLWASDDEGIASDWMHHEEWSGEGFAFDMNDDLLFTSIANGVDRLRKRNDTSSERVVDVTYRRQLELYIFGEVSAEEAMDSLKIGEEQLAKWQSALMKGQTAVSIGEGENGQLTFTGPPLKLYDISHS